MDHPILKYFEGNPNPLFWKSNIGRVPRRAKEHLFALKAINPGIQGILILDGDDRKLPEREIFQDGLKILRWKRYEAENYLLIPDLLKRTIENLYQDNELFASPIVRKIEEYFDKNKSLFLDEDYLESVPASKKLLPDFFKMAGIELSKSNYFTIASHMRIEEIHQEIIEKLNEIVTMLK